MTQVFAFRVVIVLCQERLSYRRPLRNKWTKIISDSLWWRCPSEREIVPVARLSQIWPLTHWQMGPNEKSLLCLTLRSLSQSLPSIPPSSPSFIANVVLPLLFLCHPFFFEATPPVYFYRLDCHIHPEPPIEQHWDARPVEKTSMPCTWCPDYLLGHSPSKRLK